MLGKMPFGRTGLMVTWVAFGGIPIQRLSREDGVRLVRDVLGLGVNFIDTARGYGHSEELIGEALRGIPRQELVIATKSPASDKKGFLADLEESLRRLGTDFIDVFQHHNVSSREKMAAVMGPGGAFEGMEEAIRAGKVRFPAFSAHSLPVAAEMIRTERFAAMQVPFNFVDHQAADEVIPLARDKGMGMIAMKPLGGGLLEDARLCFRYLAQFPDVVPDPGIETADQMREIISCMAIKGPLTEEERGNIEALRSALGKAWCHRCDYCQPCPQGIPISVILVAESFIRRMPLEKMRTFVEAPFKTAEACTECRQCADRCPYNLDIPSLLKRHRSSWDGLLRTGVWSESAE